MTRIQKMIEAALHAESRKTTFGMSVSASVVSPNYGYLPGHPRLHGETKLCARGMSTSIMYCGGCNNGRVPKRDSDGKKVGEWSNWSKHEDCQGLGLRLNKRYGRCGNGKIR